MKRMWAREISSRTMHVVDEGTSTPDVLVFGCGSDQSRVHTAQIELLHHMPQNPCPGCVSSLSHSAPITEE